MCNMSSFGLFPSNVPKTGNLRISSQVTDCLSQLSNLIPAISDVLIGTDPRSLSFDVTLK